MIKGTAGIALSGNVAIIGGGITGSIAASVLSEATHVDLFDQGRSGVGGRSSTRREHGYAWDHGCQFFRADIPRFRKIVDHWCSPDVAICREWTGRFECDDLAACPSQTFFGFPALPPFFIGIDGMQSIPKNILERCDTNFLCINSGTRVSRIERDERTCKWTLFGTTGKAAYHDTIENESKVASEVELGSNYDAVLLTDVSSSFGRWHRASAGVPENFALKVRERVGARVPLFTAMIKFDRSLNVEFDAKCFTKHPSLWFASRMSSKGLGDEECWTLVSTPEYAMQQIQVTPMQDEETGEFIPQSKEYLMEVPGPDLLRAFKESVAMEDFPETALLNAQRWGSAMPCQRHLGNLSATRRLISNVAYDDGRAPLAPTTRTEDGSHQATLLDFVANDSKMLYQAGDMMSRYTPGFEAAALSGLDAAHHIKNRLS